MPSSENTQPEFPGLSDLIPRWLKPLDKRAKVIAWSFGIVGAVLAGVAKLETQFTKPIAARTFYRVTESQEGASDAGSVITQYEVHNPGPGTLYGLQLRARVPDRYDEEKKEFLSKLVYERVGVCELHIETEGGESIFTITPTVAHGKAQLDEGYSFGVIFHARRHDWSPRSVSVELAGGDTIPADAHRTSLKTATWTRSLKWVSPATALILAGLFWWLHRRFRHLVADHIGSLAVEIRERARLEVQKDLQDSKRIEDGDKQSDKFEAEVNKAATTGPDSAR